MKNTSDTEVANWLFEAHLKEYSTLRDEYLKREELASQIQIYTVVAFGGLIPLIQYVETTSIQNGDVRILILLAAILFSALGWYQLDLDDRKADIDNYILQKLTPKIEALLSEIHFKKENIESLKIFEWQSYWRLSRYNNFKGFWLGFGVIGRTGVSILSAFTLLIYYVYSAHISSSLPWTVFSTILTIATGFGVLWMIITTFILRNKFSKTTKLMTAKTKSNQITNSTNKRKLK